MQGHHTPSPPAAARAAEAARAQDGTWVRAPLRETAAGAQESEAARGAGSHGEVAGRAVLHAKGLARAPSIISNQLSKPEAGRRGPADDPEQGQPPEFPGDAGLSPARPRNALLSPVAARSAANGGWSRICLSLTRLNTGIFFCPVRVHPDPTTDKPFPLQIYTCLGDGEGFRIILGPSKSADSGSGSANGRTRPQSPAGVHRPLCKVLQGTVPQAGLRFPGPRGSGQEKRVACGSWGPSLCSWGTAAVALHPLAASVAWATLRAKGSAARFLQAQLQLCREGPSGRTLA